MSACVIFVKEETQTRMVSRQSKWSFTYYERNTIATILQTTFSNGCSLIKTYEFRLKFYWSLFLGVQLTHWCRARWPPLQQTTVFQVHFLEWKLLNFKWNFTEACSLGSNWQYGSIGSENGLAPNRRQTIIWSNFGMLHWHIYAHSALMT